VLPQLGCLVQQKLLPEQLLLLLLQLVVVQQGLQPHQVA
jgi:hypothetical protein